MTEDLKWVVVWRHNGQSIGLVVEGVGNLISLVETLALNGISPFHVEGPTPRDSDGA